jgi:hypothetical protein
MAELARSTEGLARWFDPLLLGLRPDPPALLPYWIGALAIKIAPSWLHPDLAVRIAFAVLLWGAFTATWYAVYYLARTPNAQPVAFAFGGEAQPTDYARAIADGALLALIACLGLAQLGHETTPALAQLFFIAHLFYGVAALPYHRVGAALALCVGALGLSLSGGPTVGLAAGAAAARGPGPSARHRPCIERRAALRGHGAFKIAGVALLAIGAGGGARAVALEDRLAGPARGPPPERGPAQPGQAAAVVHLAGLAVGAVDALALAPAAHRAPRDAAAVVCLVPLAATWTTDFSDRSLLLALPAFATLAAFACRPSAAVPRH